MCVKLGIMSFQRGFRSLKPVFLLSSLNACFVVTTVLNIKERCVHVDLALPLLVVLVREQSEFTNFYTEKGFNNPRKFAKGICCMVLILVLKLVNMSLPFKVQFFFFF